MELSKAARESRNQYMRAWKKKNKDKVRQHTKDYWERRAERELSDPVFQAKQLAKRGMSQRQIADELGLSLGTVNRYLNAK